MDVVLADDAVELRKVLRVLLERTGVVRVVAEAGDGEEALRCVSELNPDAVLLDLSMPVRSGLDVIAELAGHARVVVLSGYSQSELASECLDRGASAYVEKGEPVSAIVEALLGEP